MADTFVQLWRSARIRKSGGLAGISSVGPARPLLLAVGAIGRQPLWVARRHGGAGHFLAQHTDYSHQKRDEAEFIDSEGVSADLANLVAATDTPIHLGGPNLRTGFEGLRHRGLNHSFIPLKRLSSVRGKNLPKNL
jgi:hypothetical protein